MCGEKCDMCAPLIKPHHTLVDVCSCIVIIVCFRVRSALAASAAAASVVVTVATPPPPMRKFTQSAAARARYGSPPRDATNKLKQNKNISNEYLTKQV